MKPSGESLTIFDPSKQEDASYCEVFARDIDADIDWPWRYNLLIFDKHVDKKRQALLPFQYFIVFDVQLAVNNDKNIAIIDPDEKFLRIGTSRKMNSLKVDNLLDKVLTMQFLVNNNCRRRWR